MTTRSSQLGSAAITFEANQTLCSPCLRAIDSLSRLAVTCVCARQRNHDGKSIFHYIFNDTHTFRQRVVLKKYVLMAKRLSTSTCCQHFSIFRSFLITFFERDSKSFWPVTASRFSTV